MKKLLLGFLVLMISLPFSGAKTNRNTGDTLVASSETVEIDLHAPAAILVENVSGTIIFQKNAHEKMYPASMTKMAGMLLILEHIEAGKMSFTDIVTCSSYAAGMGGTQIFLQPGETMSVRDLFKSVAINSANDAIVALGEAVSGSTEEFVKAMNKRVKELGTKNTNFVNPTGFHHVDHYSTAYDMALIARELLKRESTVIEFTSQYDGYIREDTNNPFWLVNTNKLIRHYAGMDGLKTGYTSDSLYCLTATAKRDNLRFISVVMREESIDNRSIDTCKLMDYGFAHFQSLVLHRGNEAITKYSFHNAKYKETDILTRTEIRVTVKKGEKLETLKTNIVLNKTNAPQKAGSTVGVYEITNSLGWKFSYELYVRDAVPQSTWWDMLIATLKNFFL